MRAMRLHAPGSPLRRDELEIPSPGPGEVLVQVAACGVCRTDLHIADGELPGCRLPATLGHEVVGHVVAGGKRFPAGTRVGIPWLGWTCGVCSYCASGRENLCERARFTGCHLAGGYADYVLAYEDYCLAIPERYSNEAAAPLLCAGLIGYRSYSKAEDAKSIGLYGFGAAAHILAQIAHAERKQVFAFTRPGDVAAQAFALQCGARWAGDASDPPPEPLDAAIIFAPSGALVPVALRAVKKGGPVICSGIHMSDIPAFPYAMLWGERRIESVANLTRADGERFMQTAARVPIRTKTSPYLLERANEALEDLRTGRFTGAAVLLP
jgi:propanol-preferring alcohol dehydrogenase